jgi:PAS domain S-box-containing protein
MSNTDAFSASRERVQDALTQPTLPPAALVLDEKGLILSWDTGAERLFCCPAVEAVGRALNAWVTPLPAPLFPGDAPAACRVLTVQGRCTGGTTFPLEITLSRIRLAGQTVCAATLRVLGLTAPALEGGPASDEDQYQLLFESSPQPMWVYDLETLRFLAVNQTAIAKYGYSRTAFLAMTLADIRPPEAIPALREAIANGPRPAGNGAVWRHRCADGSLIWVEATSHAIQYEGRAARLVVATDVTGRMCAEQKLREAHGELEKRVQERTADLEIINDYLHYEVIEREEAEDALRESEARFRTIAEATPVAVTITRETDGVFLFANAHFRRIVGLPPEAAITEQTAMDYLVERNDRERLRQALGIHGTVRNYEIRVRRVDGTAFWVSGSFRRMVFAGERVIFAAYEDISERKQAEQALRRAEEDLLRSHGELTEAYDATIEGWSHALDLRDHETEGHARRVTEATLRLARIMQVDESEMIHLRRGALLHDIGKMGIPDEILLKPGPLTQSEWTVMRRHPQYAYDMLSPIKFLRPALDIPWCHHERWDGSGYPHGLAGEDIPLPARLFSVVDVWDALRSNRPYRKGWDADRVRDHIGDLSGQHFDPHVVDTFLQMDLSEF